MLEAFKLGDPLGNALTPSLGQTIPFFGGGDRVYGQLIQFDSYLLQSKTHTLGKDNERHTSCHCTRVSAVAGGIALRMDESTLLIKA
jgi:hypothetical protein